MATAVKKAVPINKAPARKPTMHKPAKAAKAAPAKAAQKAVKPVKKATAHKVAPTAPKKAQKATQPPAKKATKRPTMPATPKKVRVRPTYTDMNFRDGSDAAIVWKALQAGGTSRKDVQTRLEEHFADQVTRGGKPKPVSTVMNQVIRRALQTQKFRVVSAWVIAPIDDAEVKAATKKVPRAKPDPVGVAHAVSRTLKGDTPKPRKKVAAKKPSAARPSRKAVPSK